MSNIIQRKLNDLRRKLFAWLMVHGVARWLVVLLLILVVSMVVDRTLRMDLAQRSIMLVLMGLAAFYYLSTTVIKPMLALAKASNEDALLLEVERKNPELRENLISSWQLARQAETEDLSRLGMSAELATATIDRGLAQAAQIDFWRALNLPLHRRDWVLMVAGLATLGGLGAGVFQSDFLRTWFNRNLMLSNDSWPQATYLEIVGAVNGRLTLPRGADRLQLVRVKENSSVTEVTVTLELDNAGGGRTTQVMKPTGRLEGREHGTTLFNIASQFRMRALGGDEVTDWVEVDLVEPPSALELSLLAKLPAYTGVDQLQFSGSGPHPLLRGSELQVEITANKSVATAELMFMSDAENGTLPMQAVAEDRYRGFLPTERVRGGEYSIRLVDENGLANVRPIQFGLTIREDQAPRVRASLLGISGMVVPRANLPLSYQANDDFGIDRAFFDLRWTTGEGGGEEAGDRDGIANLASRELPIWRREPGQESQLALDDFAVLDLEPLGLSPGTSLRLSIAAQDSCPDPVGLGRSQEFLLRVVTNEELRADLLRREIEQRKAFEQAYERQMELAAQLEMLAIGENQPAEDLAAATAARERAIIELTRNQKGVGTSLARIADQFEEFLVEVKNNRLDEAENELFPEQRIENRFDLKIIRPIRRLDQELISMAARGLDDCRLAVNDPAQLADSAAAVGGLHREILAKMRQILAAMNDAENFQEIINDLLRIKEDSKGLKLEIERKAKPGDIFDDQLDDLFDQ